MYSIFLGLSLGGIPPVWRMAKGGSPAFAFGIGAGFLAMVAIVFARPGGDGTVAWWELVYGGTVAAGAAILPGVDGSYLLLVLGQYETVLGALHQATRLELAAALRVHGPFLVGSLVALATLSNLLRWLFRRHEQPTLGVLLGFLAGSVIGIYPFQQAAAEGAPRTHYVPAAWQLAAALALVAAGFAVTRLVDRLGRTA
jgi:putative membrane protein